MHLSTRFMPGIVLTTIALLMTSCHQDTHITEFRGPDRSGHYPDTNLLEAWPDSGPEEVYYLDSTGDGYGSPAIQDDFLYFTGSRDSVSILFCADIQGNMLWSYELGPSWHSHYPGSRSTPTIAGDLLYVSTGMGDLYCVDRNKLELVWSKSLQDDFQGVLPRFGHSESPVLLDDKVFWTAGGEKHNVLAINRFSGELIWTAPGMGERSAYHPPRVITTPSGRTILVTFSAYHLMGIDAASGELLWTHEQENYPPEKREPGMGDTHSNTVIYDEGFIYYAAGDGNCGVKLRLSDDGTNIREVWRNKGFDSYMGGIVKIGNRIFGSGTVRPQLVAIDAASGELTDSLKIGRGVVIAADNMIYYYSQTGMMHLVDYSTDSLKSVSSFRIQKGSREHFSHPVIYNGVLYVRRGNAIMGYDISR